MSEQDKTTVSDKYFIPLDDAQDLPQPLAISETEKLDISELNSFSLKPQKLKYLKPMLLSMGVLLTGLVSWEFAQFFSAMYEWHWVAAVLTAGVSATAVGLLINVVRTFWGHQREMNQAFLLREQSDRYLSESHFGQSSQWVEDLKALYRDKPQAALLDEALKSLPDYNNDAEVVRHLSDNFFQKLDDLALKRITAYSQQTGILIALSPLALLDMGLALWRNIRMIDEIGQIYGLRPSRLGRIKLFRKLINNMLLAGATELIADYWTDFSSASLSNVVSTRLAQGMGVGLYTARIGIRTMALCRPLSFIEGTKPGVKTLLPHIKSYLISKLTGRGEEGS